MNAAVSGHTSKALLRPAGIAATSASGSGHSRPSEASPANPVHSLGGWVRGAAHSLRPALSVATGSELCSWVPHGWIIDVLASIALNLLMHRKQGERESTDKQEKNE